MPTTIEQPVDQPNLAPEKGLKKATQGAKPEKKDLQKLIQSFHSDLSKDRDEVWREIYSACHLVALFVKGKQVLRRSTHGDGWRYYAPLTDTGGSNIRPINVTRFYLDNVVVKWVQSQADLVVRPSKDTDQAILGARADDIIIEHYENKWYTPFFKQREARLALTTGNFVRRLYYCYDLPGKARKPIYGIEKLGGGGVSNCADCGWSGDMMEAERGCPQCGSQNVIAEPVPVVEAQSLQGMEEYEAGDIACESIPLWNLRWDLNESLENSSWVIYNRRIRKDVLRGQLQGKIKIEGGTTNDQGLEAIQALVYAGPAVGGRSSGGFLNRTDDKEAAYTDLTEMWLDPTLYGYIDLKEPVQTLAGQEIPAGPLVDTFPDGMCVMGIDEMRTILYLYNEHHRDHFVAGQYHLDPVAGAGDGAVDVIEVQRQFNIGNSQIFTQIRSQATPAVLYDKDLISGDEMDYLGHPELNVPVDLSRLPDQRSIQQAVHQLQPGQLPGHVTEYVHQFLNNMFQLTAHTTDFSGGLPGVNNTTATGAQIGSALAQSLHAPQLQLLAEVNKRTAELALKLFHKYCKDERYLRLAGKNDAEYGLWIKGSDVDTDVVIEIVPESWLPQSGFEKRERLKEFIQFFGGADGLSQAMVNHPQMVGELVKLTDVSLDLGDWDSAIRMGRRRIEQMKVQLPTVMQQAAGMPPEMMMQLQAQGIDPAMVLAKSLMDGIQPPPDIRENGHEAAAAYYREWLTTDEGLKADKILYTAVKMLADQELMFIVQGGPMGAAQQSAMAMGMLPQIPPAGAPPAGPPSGEGPPEPQAQQTADSANGNLSAPQPGAMGGQ
jgi:hypothetical protein